MSQLLKRNVCVVETALIARVLRVLAGIGLSGKLSILTQIDPEIDPKNVPSGLREVAEKRAVFSTRFPKFMIIFLVVRQSPKHTRKVAKYFRHAYMQ